MMKISEKYEWIKMAPEKGNFLFGYYDRCPWNHDTTLHLALKIPHRDHLPEPGETADVGIIERESRKFHKLAETRSWCHQQGAMTLWLKNRPNCFLFNDFCVDERKMVARVFHVDKGECGRYEMPIYTVSADGRWGVSLNFGRIPRRGYSYADVPVPANQPVPDLDKEGMFLVNLETGECKLIVSYRQFIEKHSLAFDLENCYTWLNHAIFNSDSSRLLVIFRHTQLPIGSGGHWKTNMFTCDLDGSNLICALSQIFWRKGAISHQIWGRTPREVLVDANWCENGQEYVVFAEDKRPIQAKRISKGMGPHGHLIFSPDGKWMAADTYPDAERRQRLALVDVETGEWEQIGLFNHRHIPDPGDLRCDLHPRWSPDSSIITVDSIHEGEENIYMLQLG